MGAMQAAQAGAFLLREQSAVGQGLSTAGAAAGGAGLGSMFWNPATMTDYAGLNSSSVLTGIAPSAQSTATGGAFIGLGGNSGDIGQSALLPASYYSYQLGEQVWIGASITSPFGLVTRNPVVWAGSTYGETSKISSVDLNPSIAYKLNDMWSFAVGLQFLYFKAFQTQDVSPLALAAVGTHTLTLKADGWGVGATAGVTFKPFAGTEIGLGYRSSVKENLEGSVRVPTLGLAYQMKLSATLPDIYTLGLRQRITSDFDLLAGIEYDKWHLGTLPVINKATGAQLLLAGVVPVSVPFNYKDGWLFSLGGEYKWNPNLTLRGGLAYEKSPIDNSNRRPTLPDSNRIWASVGAGYKVSDRLTADIGYSHLFGANGSILLPAGGGAPGLVATTKAHVDILSASLTYRYDTPVRPALVAKY